MSVDGVLWRLLATETLPNHTRCTSTPHPIIEVSELVQPAINHLLDVSPKGLVSLACTYRGLKEQALATM